MSWVDDARRVCVAVLAVTPARVAADLSASIALDSLAAGDNDRAQRFLRDTQRELAAARRVYASLGHRDAADQISPLIDVLIPIAFGPMRDEPVLSALLDDSEPMLSAERDARESEPAEVQPPSHCPECGELGGERYSRGGLLVCRDCMHDWDEHVALAAEMTPEMRAL